MSGIMLASVGNSYGSAPVNTVAPAVTGTATVGQTLSTTNGTWLGAPAPTFTYQWQRTGVDIGGATSSTYVLVAADYANTIRCVVKATNSVAPAGVTANSNSTASVAGNAPVNTVAPVVSGTATFGQTLSTTDGTWTGVPTPTFTYQWQRVTTPISGATSSTYVLVAADVGNTIRCEVTATNAVAAVSANSNSTAAVVAAVPGAPTIGTATATSPTTATVTYTAPASNGGATITLYTATSSPSGLTGTLATAGSGTITVSGLTASTSYTFTVKATNSAGQSAASAASNSITTDAQSQQAFTCTGNFTWVAPSGVTSISILTVGGGGGGGAISGGGGAGGGLRYRNGYTVTPGSSYCLTVGGGGSGGTPCSDNSTAGGRSTFINTSTVYANGGGRGGRASGAAGGCAGTGGGTCVAGGCGGRGGDSRLTGNNYNAGGGGGAAGYSGNGGIGAGPSSANGSGGGGGGGGGGANSPGQPGPYSGGDGGGVGILGQGANGTAGASGSCSVGQPGTAGSGGSGQTYGGGGNGASGCFTTAGNGGGGAVRIIWPGTTRTFPSTNTGNL